MRTPIHNVTSLHARAWKLLTAIVSRRPDLRIIETHPGGGQYDCLSLYSTDQTHIADLNLNGRFHVFNRLDGADHGTQSSHDWQGMFDSPEELNLQVLNWAGLTESSIETSPGVHVEIYRFISAYLQYMADVSNEWQCRNGYFDSSGMDGCFVVYDFDRFRPAKERLSQQLPDDFLGQSAYRFWFLRKNGEPRICMETTGTLWLADDIGYDPFDIREESAQSLVRTTISALGEM